jgi:hypothetical protein
MLPIKRFLKQPPHLPVVRLLGQSGDLLEEGVPLRAAEALLLGGFFGLPKARELLLPL